MEVRICVCACVNVRGVPTPPDKESLPANRLNLKVEMTVEKHNAACFDNAIKRPEKYRSVKTLLAGTYKANAGSQKAMAINAWLLAHGSHKRQKLC